VCAQMPFVVLSSYCPDSSFAEYDGEGELRLVGDTGGRVRMARGAGGFASWVEIQDLRGIANGTRIIKLPTGGSLDFSSTSAGERTIAMVMNMLEDQGYSLLHATPGPARRDPSGPGGYIEYVMHTSRPLLTQQEEEEEEDSD